MAKQNLRALIENIVIEALEEWMDESDLDEADSKGGVKAFGGGEVEKKSKKNEASKKKLPPAFLKNTKKKSKKA